MANALKKITTAAKAMRKRKPKMSWKAAIKAAGKRYRAGALKPKRRKTAAVKKSVVKRKSGVRKKAKRITRRDNVTIFLDASKKPHKRRVYRRIRTNGGRYSTVKRISGRRRSVGKMKPVQLLLIAGLAVGVLYLLTRKQQPQIVQVPGNTTRNNLASDILLYAQAANMTAAAITKLIQQINASNDSQVQNIYDVIKAGGDPTANVAGFPSYPAGAGKTLLN